LDRVSGLLFIIRHDCADLHTAPLSCSRGPQTCGEEQQGIEEKMEGELSRQTPALDYDDMEQNHGLGIFESALSVICGYLDGIS
jgi:hypothetical protein